jgi:hypothetical protein
MDRYPMTENEKSILNYLNIGFSTIFLLEMIIKFIGLKISYYFKDLSNIFDFIIVIASWVEIGLFYGLENINNFRVLKALQAIRIIRLLRVFKLSSSWEQFHLVLRTM